MVGTTIQVTDRRCTNTCLSSSPRRILFAPAPPQPSSSELQPADHVRHSRLDEDEQEDPFEQGTEEHTSTLASSSTSDWQHVSSTSTAPAHSRGDAHQHAAATSRSPSAVTPPHYASSGQIAEAGQSSTNEADESSNTNHSRWSAVPIPRRDTSSFFDDEDEDDDELFSDDKLINRNDHHHSSGERSAFLDENSQSIYRDLPFIQQRRRQPQLQDGTAAAEETDMLSLPSSLSVSDRSTSDDLPSPRFDYLDSAFSLTGDAGGAFNADEEEEIAGNSNITLTEAALSRIARADTPTSPKELEAALTSGSEDEAGNDEDEAALSRAPDAISAGIRPSRRKALQSIRAPSQLSDAISGGRVSSSQKSATKRRHRQSGISDKGSKRSNTSASLLNVQDSRPPVPSARSRDRSTGEAQGVTHKGRHADSPARGRTARFAQAAREIFSVDEEVMNMMAQPGSVFRSVSFDTAV